MKNWICKNLGVPIMIYWFVSCFVFSIMGYLIITGISFTVSLMVLVWISNYNDKKHPSYE